MRIGKSSYRAVTTAIAASALVTLTFGASTASAAPGADNAGPKKAQRVATELGPSKSAGVYISSKSKATVVNVTTKKAADKVRDAGAKPRVV